MQESDEQAIRNLIATWIAASKAGDHDTVLSLMADDVVFLVPGQPPMRGKAAFAAAQTGMSGIDIDGTSEIEEIQVRGGWAWVWTRLTVVVTPRGGAPMKRAGTTLSILERRDGRWLLLRDANLLAVVKD